MQEKQKIVPALQVGLLVWLLYNLIIYATWFLVGADYADLASRNVIVQRLVLPEVLGAIFIVVAVSRLGWWPPVAYEDRRGGPRWSMWVFLPFVAAFMAILLAGTDWPAISVQHFVFLAFACLLIGFNEEILTRGVLVVAARGSMRHEVWVWFFSSALFGLMHVPNGFFGIGFSASFAQAVFTFLLGSGLYVLRRVSGTIVLPVIVHALWDFSTFSHQVTSTGAPLLATLFQFLAYMLALVLVIAVLLHDRTSRARGTATATP
ncbi:MAG: CPBP family intramembrane metalloprotease [Rhodobacteraceae bacterium]|nr:CPBP family intramembrane metalloprotease [Paracoccaceae bacterium]